MANTPIAKIRDMAAPETVEIPGWHNGDTVTVTLKRPSLIEMTAAGEIPNPLLGIASQLFTDGAGKTTAREDFAAFAEMLHQYARAAMVKPSYDELTDNNISLTDEQVMAVYSYGVEGVAALKRFRRK